MVHDDVIRVGDKVAYTITTLSNVVKEKHGTVLSFAHSSIVIQNDKYGHSSQQQLRNTRKLRIEELI